MNENEQIIQDGTTSDYLQNLVNDRDTMVTNLNTMGVPAEANETFTDLAQRILEIPQGDDIQYDTMPVPSIDYLDKIVQYVGETTVQEPIYTNGYFYKCVSDEQDPATYSWENINVQNDDSSEIVYIPEGVFSLTTESTNAEILTAFGGSDNLTQILEKLSKKVPAYTLYRYESDSSQGYTYLMPTNYWYRDQYMGTMKTLIFEAIYTPGANVNNKSTRYYIALLFMTDSWSVGKVTSDEIATTELTGLLANLQTTDKTNLVSAINELASSGSPIDVLTVSLPTSTYGLNLTAWDYCTDLYSLKNETKIYLLKYNSYANVAAILFIGTKAPNGYSSQTIITGLGTDNGITVATRYISNTNNNFYNNKRWINNQFTLDQDTSNGIISKNRLVNTITSSSTNYDCPSAKAVYDLFDSITNANNISY